MQSVEVINVAHDISRIKEENDDFCVDVGRKAFDQIQ